MIEQLPWLAGRSAGIVAWFLLSGAVGLGLLVRTPYVGRRARPVLELTRDRVGVLALGMLAFHGVLLLAAPEASPLSYRPLWTAAGVAAGVIVALAVGRWAREPIAVVAWLLSAVHVVGAGTDAGSLWLQVPFYVTVLYGVVLLGVVAWHAWSAPAEAPAKVTPPPPPAPAPPPSRIAAPLWSRGGPER